MRIHKSSETENGKETREQNEIGKHSIPAAEAKGREVGHGQLVL